MHIVPGGVCVRCKWKRFPLWHCQRWGKKQGFSRARISHPGKHFFLKCNFKWKHILQTPIPRLLLLMFSSFCFCGVFPQSEQCRRYHNVPKHTVKKPLKAKFVVFQLIKHTWHFSTNIFGCVFLGQDSGFTSRDSRTVILSNMWGNPTLSLYTWMSCCWLLRVWKCEAGSDRQPTEKNINHSSGSRPVNLNLTSASHGPRLNFIVRVSLAKVTIGEGFMIVSNSIVSVVD